MEPVKFSLSPSYSCLYTCGGNVDFASAISADLNIAMNGLSIVRHFAAQYPGRFSMSAFFSIRSYVQSKPSTDDVKNAAPAKSVSEGSKKSHASSAMNAASSNHAQLRPTPLCAR